MPRDEDYFSRDKTFLERVREEVRCVSTLADLKRIALFYRWRSAGPLIAEKIDRLTERKVKADGTRDGRWIWENVKARMGRRQSSEKPVDVETLCVLQTLIVREYEQDEFWGLIYNWRNRLVFRKKLKPNDRARVALDVLTILIEQKHENETLQD